MQIYHILIFITAISKIELYLIQDHNTKICANCKFFISNKNQCSKFGDLDIITGKYNYEDAVIVRKEDEKCGADAIFYKKNYFKFIYNSFDFLLERKFLIFLLSFYIIPIIILVALSDIVN